MGGYMKKRTVLYILAGMLSLVFFIQGVQAGNRTPDKGESFPDIALAMPDKPMERDYLGLKGKKTFKLSQVKADVVIIEIYSMYCPYCQKEAPTVNQLYDMINKRTDIKNRVKIIGIGAGNTPVEIGIFRNHYNIQFPLVSDESFAVHKAVGEVRTPYFFVVKINTSGPNSIIYSKVGSIQDPNQFLDMVLQNSGLKKEAIK
jgi:peroxiredoxin